MNVLITGARSGIGYRVALELLNRGHFVYLTVHTDEQLKGLYDCVELEGKSVQCFKFDITHKEDREVVQDLDIDVLINNAAIGNGGSIAEAGMASLRENFEVNFFATIELTKAFLTKMLENNKGRIIMMSSMIAEVPQPWFGMYSATKAALSNLSMALSKELKSIKSNVKIVVIEPGFYKTGFNEVMMDNKYDNENSLFKDYRKKIYDDEHLKVDTLTEDNLKSIVDKIVEAVETDKPKALYKAPLKQAVMEKAYIIKNK